MVDLVSRVFALLAAVVTVGIGCGSSSDEGSATSASQVTTADDAGSDAKTIDPCAPCAERFAEGAATYEAARRHCFCGDDVCHDACASTQCMRTPIAANDTCNACINDSYGKCIQAVEAACESDAECTHYAACKVPASCNAQK
jgi:hypothetical protein